MPAADWIRKLYAYNEWANARILAAASGLTDAQLREDQPGMGSIGDTLRHIARAQHGWWCFWTDTERLPLPELPAVQVVDAIDGWFRSSHDELRAVADSLDESGLERTYEDTDDDGRPVTFRLWEMMVHVVNHGTQHRSEAAAALTVFGHSPGDLDFCDFVGASSQGEHPAPA
ncbi:MAG TPA: DinB family protein [Dehalococcoidia bacterium]|nr:DinB family protein [Dehalococcoidia bacterium]